MPPETDSTQPDSKTKTDSTQPPATPPAAPATPTAGEPAGSAGGVPPPQPASDGKFTQADLDRIAGQTRKDAKSAERAALLKELGVSDLDAAKAALKAAEDAKKAQMTETERLQAEKAEADRKLADATAAAQKAEQDKNTALLQAAVVSKAAGRFANPQAVVKLADLSKVKLEDGQFVGVDEALEALAKAEPWTLAQQVTKVPSIGPTNPAANSKSRTDDDRRKEYFQGGGRKAFFEEGGVKLPNT